MIIYPICSANIMHLIALLFIGDSLMKSFSHSKTSDVALNYQYKSRGFKMIDNKWQLAPQLKIGEGYFDSIALNSVSKIKIKGEKGPSNCETPTYVLKITVQDKDNFYAFDQDLHIEWMLRLVWGKFYMHFETNPPDEEYFNICEAEIPVKKGLNSWHKLHVRITKEGLACFEDTNKKPVLFIEQVGEIWSRFQLVEGKKYMVFKMRYHLIKYEFGIPLHNLLKWCRALYSLIDFC